MKYTRILVVINALIFCILLQITYKYFISPHYFYQGFIYIEPSTLGLFGIYLFAIIPALFLPIKLIRPSNLLTWFLYCIVYIPSCLIPILTINDLGNVYFWYLSILVFSFAIIKTSYKIQTIKLSRIKIKNNLFIASMIFFAAIIHIYIISIFGLRFNLVSLNEVYDVREDYKETASANGRMIVYSILWLANVVNPVLVAIGIIQKKKALVLIGVIGQVFIYSITGWKSVLFSSILILGLFILLKLNKKRFGLNIIMSFNLVLFMGLFEKMILHSDFIINVFVRRMIITPGLLTGFYLEFYSNNPKALLAHSIFSSIIEKRYELNPANQIGLEYFGNPQMSANTNFWADSFANFGLLGVMVFSIVFVAILWIVDSVAVNRNYKLVLLLLVVQAYSLTNSALITVLVTHGLLLLIIIIYLTPFNKIGEKNENTNPSSIFPRRE